jgi:hypothetical protein
VLALLAPEQQQALTSTARRCSKLAAARAQAAIRGWTVTALIRKAGQAQAPPAAGGAAAPLAAAAGAAGGGRGPCQRSPCHHRRRRCRCEHLAQSLGHPCAHRRAWGRATLASACQLLGAWACQAPWALAWACRRGGCVAGRPSCRCQYRGWGRGRGLQAATKTKRKFGNEAQRWGMHGLRLIDCCCSNKQQMPPQQSSSSSGGALTPAAAPARAEAAVTPARPAHAAVIAARPPPCRPPASPFMPPGGPPPPPPRPPCMAGLKIIGRLGCTSKRAPSISIPLRSSSCGQGGRQAGSPMAGGGRNQSRGRVSSQPRLGRCREAATAACLTNKLPCRAVVFLLLPQPPSQQQKKRG